MPIPIKCPRCGCELTAPDSLLGKVAACPDCNNKFAVAGEGDSGVAQGSTSRAASSDSHPAGDFGGTTMQGSSAPPPPPSSLPPSSLPPSSLSPSSEPPRAPASKKAKSPSSKRSSPKSGRPSPEKTKAKTKTKNPSAKKPLPATGDSAGTSTLAEPPVQARVQAPARRKPKQAKFVSADSHRSAFQLGADGQLPELKLEAGKPAKSAEVAESSSPWLLAVVLALSLGAAALMLFIPSGSVQRESTTKAGARAQVGLHYIGKQAPFQPHETILRKALQAHSGGQYKEERRLYRRVMDMLNSESHDAAENKYKGLTGRRHDANPPSDGHLREQLSILLAEK